MQNFYEILGVSTSATEKEIRNSYIAKIKKYHPDTFNGDKSFAEQQTALITEAYTTLKDTTLRKRYDLRNNISVSFNMAKHSQKSSSQNQAKQSPQTKPQKKQEAKTKNATQNTKNQKKREEKPVQTNKNVEKTQKYTKKQLIEDIFIVLLSSLLIFILVLAIF